MAYTVIRYEGFSEDPHKIYESEDYRDAKAWALKYCDLMTRDAEYVDQYVYHGSFTIIGVVGYGLNFDDTRITRMSLLLSIVEEDDPDDF